MERQTVWIHLPGQPQPVPCGLLEWDGQRARFAYGRRYPARPGAISLAPGMSLDAAARGEWFHPVQDDPLPGPIADVAPGRWAEYVMTRVLGRRPNALELLLNARARIGALSFSPSPADLPAEAPMLPLLDELDSIARATEAAEGAAGEPLALAMRHGPSVGGRRPKADFADADGWWWIAKLGSRLDTVRDQPLLEAFGLSLARACSIRVPVFEVRRVRAAPVLLVRRFDHAPGRGRLHVLSAKTLLGLCERNLDLDGSYPAIAQQLRRLGATADLAMEWFDRCVFNVLIGNTDDHPLNHLFAWDGRALQLLPAFDLEPQGAGLARQQMQLGPQGTLSTLDNVLAAHTDYGLTLKAARQRVQRLKTTVTTQWRAVAREVGLDDSQCDFVRGGLRS